MLFLTLKRVITDLLIRLCCHIVVLLGDTFLQRPLLKFISGRIAFNPFKLIIRTKCVSVKTPGQMLRKLEHSGFNLDSWSLEILYFANTNPAEYCERCCTENPLMQIN